MSLAVDLVRPIRSRADQIGLIEAVRSALPSDQETNGVEPVDAAQLEAQVAPYVGRGIDWRADYVAVDGSSVLVVTVEPPKWGDPIHPARKAFQPGTGGLRFHDGTVFVRHQASTEDVGGYRHAQPTGRSSAGRSARSRGGAGTGNELTGDGRRFGDG